MRIFRTPSVHRSSTRLAVASLSSLGLALALAFPGSAAHAAGLGRINVLSNLGQPLRAEIELTSVSAEEVDSLTVRIAPQAAFTQARVEFSNVLNSVRMAVETRPNNTRVVRLTSNAPINEPFLDLVVELGAGGGRVLRTYTLLLDPPEMRANRPEPVAPVAVAPAPAPAPAPAAQTVRPAAPAPAAAPAAPAQTAGRPANYRVQSGDTLMKVARNLQGSVTLEQMLVALYLNNQNAFDGPNMNRLRAGAVLRVPDEASAAARSRSEAVGIITAQTNDFAAYRRALAGNAAPAAAESGAREAAGKVTARVEDKKGAVEAKGDQVKLSKPTNGKASPGGAEDAVVRERALLEANSRVAMLEKTVADLQKLIELKNQGLQELQKQAQLQGKDIPAAPAGAAAPAPGGVPAPVAAPAKAPAKSDSMMDTVTHFVSELPENPIAIAGGGAVVVLVAGYALIAMRRKRGMERFDDSLLPPSAVGVGDIRANSMFGTIGGASVDTSNNGFNSNFVPQGAETVDTNEVDPVAEADVYIAYGRDAQAEEILKEALRNQPDRVAVRLKLLELYVKRKDTTHFESLALELFSSTGGSGPDWKIAAALGRKLAPANPLYKDPDGDTQVAAAVAVAVEAVEAAAVPAAAVAVAALAPAGADLAAAPAMAAAPDTPAPAPSMDLDFDMTPAASAAPAAAAPAAPVAEEASALEFDLDLNSLSAAPAAPAPAPAPAAAPEPAGELLADLDFEPVKHSGTEPIASLDGPLAPEPGTPSEVSAAAAPVAAAAAPAPAKDENTLDFEFVLPSFGDGKPDETPAAAAAAEAHVPKLDIGDISLDLDTGEATREPSSADAAREQEMATKLDLAVAYRDIGDVDGARELLDEVIKSGDAVQIEKATALRKALG